MSREEITRGLANRFVHSQAYIALYLAMAALSVTTVVLSMVNDCPTLAFYILEIIINGAMILEVGIRFVAFGRVRCSRLLSMMIATDTSLCGPTLIVLAILEIMVQHHGCDYYRVLCHHATRHPRGGL